MRKSINRYYFPALLVIMGFPFLSIAQQKPEQKKKKHFIKEVYASWGYNQEWY